MIVSKEIKIYIYFGINRPKEIVSKFLEEDKVDRFLYIEIIYQARYLSKSQKIKI